MPILADYFIVVSVPTDRVFSVFFWFAESSIEAEDVQPTVLYRYPEQDHKKHRFPENAPFVRNLRRARDF